MKLTHFSLRVHFIFSCVYNRFTSHMKGYFSFGILIELCQMYIPAMTCFVLTGQMELKNSHRYINMLINFYLKSRKFRIEIEEILIDFGRIVGTFKLVVAL